METSNPFYLASILINGVIAFFIVAYFVELYIVFRSPKSFREKALLRQLPFLSLFLNIFFTQKLVLLLNPLADSSLIQNIALSFFPELKKTLIEKQTTLVEYLGKPHESYFFYFLYRLFVGITLFKVVKAAFKIFWDIFKTKLILKLSRPYFPVITHIDLKIQLKKGADIYLSPSASSPISLFPKTIILPALMTLSEDDQEIILAKEWEHIKHYDPLSRYLTELLSALYWWVPTISWRNKMIEEQDLACRQNLALYGITEDSYESAYNNAALN